MQTMGGGPAKEHLLCVLPWPEPKDILSNLRQRFPGLELSYFQVATPRNRNGGESHNVPQHLWRQATVLCTLFSLPGQVSDVPNLELVHLISAGSNQIHTAPLYTDTDITITTSSGIHGPQIAEWVVMTGLVASHGYRQLYDLQKKRQWGGSNNGKAQYQNVRDMVGRRIGILGYGSIGRQVGRVAKAMGMEVIAYTATPKDTAEKKKDKGFVIPGTGDAEGTIPVEWYSGLDKDSLRHFLKQALDWLVVSVPLTEQTRHFLSTEEFKILSDAGKKPAFVTNIARGPIIDQPSFITALKDGTLAGAALDVTDPEPLPSDSELWGLENVILTPHISGNGSDYIDRTFKILEENLSRKQRGEKLLNVVRRERGY